MYDPLVSRIIYRKRVLGVDFTFRLTYRVSTWRKLVWPIPLNMTTDDNE